jgi:hypothetical protein
MRQLLVQIEDDAEAPQIEAFIMSIGGVDMVSDHGDCCCGNCPWGGDHRMPGER